MTELAKPTIQGPAASAWRLVVPSPTSALVAWWLIEHPTAHMAWSRWLLSVAHLRELPGLPPAIIHRQGVTHELTIMALDPEHYPDHDGLGRPPNGWHYLTPADVVEQFQASSDQMAERMAELAVSAVTNGRISPDQDYRTAWHEAIQNTAKHYEEGKHGLA